MVKERCAMHEEPLRAAGEQEKIHHGLFVPLEDAFFFSAIS